MNRHAERRLLLFLALLTPCTPEAWGQQPEAAGGFTPDEAVRRMVVPEGFHAEVFAAEPMVRQPVSACFDERGRLWVVEYLQYPNPAGLKPVTVDQYLRTEYDKVPEPPPRGARGADRIKILEDTDGDGRADKVKIFADGLNLASALAVGHGGVFVGQAPYLLFYPDRDRDDRPDGDPEVLLAGFGLQDAHATVNSMTWGPDGWLYGAQGSTVTARIRGQEFQQAIWRYHPQDHRFEVFAEGGGNTWGLDFDLAGNAFGSSNGAYIAFHMVQGGYYLKGFAKHGPLHNPRAYGYFGPIDYRGPKVGGHVTPGGIIYKGDAFPPSFRGSFIGGNLLSNAVYWHLLERNGSTYAGRHGGTLVDARDRWFRPIDLLAGPDAAVYVVDWYDKRAAHLDPRDTWDRTNGRIYRVVFGDRRTVPPFDLSKRSSADLIALRTSPNDWFPTEARRILAERRDSAIVPELKRLLADDRDEVVALRDLWALYVSGGLDDATAKGLLDHPVPGVRRWTVRLLGDDHRMNPALRDKLAALAGSEPDAMVRSQLASSAQRWGADDALPILGRLARHDEDRRDPHIPNLLWWAFEWQLRQDRDAVVALLGTAEMQRAPLVAEALLGRVARALVSDGSDADFAACARLLAAAPGKELTARLLAGMDEGLQGRKLAQVPAPMAGPLARLWAASKPAPGTVLIRVAARMGSPVAIAAAADKARDKRSSASDRVAMIELLGQLGRPDDLPRIVEILRTDPSPAIQLAAVAALGAYADPTAARPLLERYPSAAPAVRARILAMLGTRREWATALLDAIEHRRIAAKDLTAAQVQLIAQRADPALVARLEAVWGKVPRVGSPEKKKRIAEIRGLLPEGDKGNAARGKPIFKENCAVCHKLFGDGETIGPDLTGAERGDLDFLMTSLVDPSSQVRKEYQSQTIAMRDGRVLTGLVVEEDDRTLTLVDGNRQKTVVPRDGVEEARPSEVSLMPEGLLDKLTEPQIRDLFRYLQSPGGR
jgi:putative membrane-bound dehydrogenase-like protein